MAELINDHSMGKCPKPSQSSFGAILNQSNCNFGFVLLLEPASSQLLYYYCCCYCIHDQASC